MVRIILLGLVTMFGFSQSCAAQTPHALLGNDTPEDAKKALEIMKKDPTWVTRRDSDRQTPLHMAACFNHLSVVKWLLANGADVDAQTRSRATPLHLTDDPAIAKVILEKKPNLKLTSSSNGSTALQGTIKDLRRYTEISNRTLEVKQKTDDLQKIVELYVEHLGDDIDLISAIRLGQCDTVKKIVNQNPAAANGEKNGPNPLREAVNWEQFDICKFLVEEYEVDVNDFEGGGYPIIISALEHPCIVKYLVDNGADLKTRITLNGFRSGFWFVGDEATALHFAARDGVPETINIFLDAGVDPFAFATAHNYMTDEEEKQTALEVAAYFGKTDTAIAILKHPKFKATRGKIRQQVLDKSLAIGSSCCWVESKDQDYPKLLDALITHGANCKTTHKNHTPIQIAASRISPVNNKENDTIKKMVSVLRKHGAELDVFSAVAIGDFESLAKLLAKDPKASNSYSIDGCPALHMATKMNSPKAVELLLDAGCDIEVKNKDESTGSGTPLSCVAFWGHEGIAKTLIKRGANVNAKDEQQVTPLHEAVSFGNVQIAKLLLENGADKQAKDHEGKTPIQWARNNESAEQFKKLFSEFTEPK